MKLYIDFETRSTVDLRKTSSWVYSESPDTDIQCLAVKVDTAPSRLWAPLRYRKKLDRTIPTITDDGVLQAIAEADEIHAHNVEFERALWHNVCHRRWQWPDLPAAKLRCTAAKAAACGLPRSLDAAARALGSAAQKDQTGYRLMLKLCKPRNHDPLAWWEDPADLNGLFRYCMQDTDTEADVDVRIPDLSETELRVWQLDQAINARGVKVDLALCRRMIELIGVHTEKLLAEFQHLTGGRVLSPKQVAATLELLENEEGIKLPNLQRNTVTEARDDTVLSKRADRLLEIRQLLAKASTAKYRAAVRWACADGRIRSASMYHGANTGRWAGKGMQLQNLPRGKFKDVGPCIDMLMAGDMQGVELLYPDLMTTASTLLRSALFAEGEYFAGDFKAIEGCVLAWITGETDILEVYRSGDAYKVTASWIYDRPPTAITKDERQVGKVAELALGYQGGVNALSTMAAGYGVELSDDLKERIVETWRKKRSATVRFWAEVEAAAKKAIVSKQEYRFGKVSYLRTRAGIACKLPSGRLMRYLNPSIRPHPEYRGREQIIYWGQDSFTKKWSEIETYGGKLTENIVQAVARDILAEAMLRVTADGYPVAFHVHDEIVCEVPEAESDDRFKRFLECMAVSPAWATGCPIAVEGWRGKRYRK